MSLLVYQVASQRTWPGVGDIDDCWVLAWQMAQIAVAPWLPWLDVPTARRYAGDPDDGNADGNDRGLWDMVRGIRAATPALGELCTVVNGDRTWSDTLAEIKSGRPFAAAVMGDSLPRVYTRVPHQVVLFHEPTVGLRVADPMAPDRSEPYRIPTLAAMAACASFAGAGKQVGVLFPTVEAALTTYGRHQAAIALARVETAAPLQARLLRVADETRAHAARVAAITEV